MAVFIKSKRVSGPLDQKVRARLLLLSSGGSGSDDEMGPDHCCLVHAFPELDEPQPRSQHKSDDSDGEIECFYADASEMLRDFTRADRPATWRELRSAVTEAAAESASVYGRAALMAAKLRGRGYNAGLCTAKWESGGGLTAGSHEYIDVIVCFSNVNERYIVDVDFAAQFEVARARAEYERLVATLPTVMVGKEEEMRILVRTMAEAAKRSLKSKGLSVPPWRKRR